MEQMDTQRISKILGGAWGKIGKATALEQGMAQTRALDVCLC